MRAMSDATAGLLKPMQLAKTDRLYVSVDKDLRKFNVKITAEQPPRGWRNYPSAAAQTGWLARVPEKRQLENKSGEWQLGATDYTAEIIRAVWPTDQVEFEPDARALYEYLLLSTTAQDANAEKYALYCESRAVPDPLGLELHWDHPLAKYQQVAAHCAAYSEGYGLFMEQGTGKTPVTVAAVCADAKDRHWTDPVRCIIVCPNNVRHNWVHEFERFATVPGKANVIKGGEIARVGQLIEAMVPEEDCQFSVAIISYDGMVRSIDTICAMPWDRGVLDEAHYIQRPETKRFRMAMRLRDACKRRMVLTGTPISNTPLDLYALFEFMGDGWSGFRSWKEFKNFYGVYVTPEGDGYKKLVGVQNQPFMKERLARTSFIIRKKEALPDLPDKVYDTDEVEMTSAQQEIYDKIAEELAYEIESELDSSENKAITINNVLTKLLRLAQITAGFATYDEIVDPVSLEVKRPKIVEHFSPDPKLDRLVEIAREKTPEQKTIVWSCFVPCIKAISARFEREEIKHAVLYGQTNEADRLEAERAFNYDRECRWLIGNPAAGGTGLNLLGYPPHGGDDYETNCDHVIYYAQDWSYTKRAQSEDRCHRRGTRANVRITDLMVPGTMDEDIRCRVLEKKLVAMDIADVREILKNLLVGLRGVK